MYAFSIIAYLLKNYSTDLNENNISCSQRYRERLRGSDSSLIRVRKHTKWQVWRPTSSLVSLESVHKELYSIIFIISVNFFPQGKSAVLYRWLQ